MEEEKKQIIIELEGKIPSKKNTYKIRKSKGLYKPAEVINWENSALWQIKGQQARWSVVKTPLKEPVIVKVYFLVHSRSDLDNKYTAIQDVLVKAGILADDKVNIVRRFEVEGEIIPSNQQEKTYIIIESYFPDEKER